MLRKSLAVRKSLVQGVGINDADYKVLTRSANGNVICNYYGRWVGMLRRCYSSEYQSRQPTYKGCTVCSEWLTFSNFKEWMEKQDWKGKELDKDLLTQGNKIYSPLYCIFVDKKINTLTTTRKSLRGKYKVGVTSSKSGNKFVSICNDGNRKQVHLGVFITEQEAHNAYCDYKYKLIAGVALQQTEPLKSALLNYKISEY